jgi:hypothetical protein
MDEHQARTFILDGFPKFAQLGDRLAAKSSTKVPKKHQEHRLALTQRGDRFAVLRVVFLQKLRGDCLASHL